MRVYYVPLKVKGPGCAVYIFLAMSGVHKEAVARVRSRLRYGGRKERHDQFSILAAH
jgi:hypothetical protein